MNAGGGGQGRGLGGAAGFGVEFGPCAAMHASGGTLWCRGSSLMVGRSRRARRCEQRSDGDTSGVHPLKAAGLRRSTPAQHCRQQARHCYRTQQQGGQSGGGRGVTGGSHVAAVRSGRKGNDDKLTEIVMIRICRCDLGHGLVICVPYGQRASLAVVAGLDPAVLALHRESGHGRIGRRAKGAVLTPSSIHSQQSKKVAAVVGCSR